MKILVVDDSKAMRMIVLRNLRQCEFKDPVFFEAADGRQALEVIEAEKPDLILSDWNMPEMSGLELCQALDFSSLNLVFGFVTSESTAEMRALAEEAGAHFLVAKPFDAFTLRDVITDALQAAGRL